MGGIRGAGETSETGEVGETGNSNCVFSGDRGKGVTGVSVDRDEITGWLAQGFGWELDLLSRLSARCMVCSATWGSVVELVLLVCGRLGWSMGLSLCFKLASLIVGCVRSRSHSYHQDGDALAKTSKNSVDS